MKIDFDTIMKDIEGNDLEEPTKTGMKKTTLRGFMQGALLAAFPDDTGITGEEKFRRYELVMKANRNEELTIEDVALIKTLIGKAYSPLIVGQAWKIMEG